MSLMLRYFAQAAEKTGCREEAIELEGGRESIPLDELKKLLAARHPKLAPVLAVCRLAVDGEYATADTQVRADAEVAVIPPVSGG